MDAPLVLRPSPVRPGGRRPWRTALLFGMALAALAALSGCGGGSDGGGNEGGGAPTDAGSPIGFAEVAAATLAPGDPVPAPTEPVVLTVTGRIGTTNVGDALELDLPTLERIGLVEYRIDDVLAEGRVVTFRGVLLDRLLAVAAVDPAATTLRTVALNDYAVDIPISDADAYPVLVATSVDGERMPVDRFGPLRIIYPYGAFGLEPPEVDERLIWQLRSIEVA